MLINFIPVSCHQPCLQGERFRSTDHGWVWEICSQVGFYLCFPLNPWPTRILWKTGVWLLCTHLPLRVRRISTNGSSSRVTLVLMVTLHCMHLFCSLQQNNEINATAPRNNVLDHEQTSSPATSATTVLPPPPPPPPMPKPFSIQPTSAIKMYMKKRINTTTYAWIRCGTLHALRRAEARANTLIWVYLITFPFFFLQTLDYFFGFKDWGTANLTLPGRLRPMSWSLRLLMRSRSRFVPALSERKTDMAVLEALPLLVWPGMIFTLYLRERKDCDNHSTDITHNQVLVRHQCSVRSDYGYGVK